MMEQARRAGPATGFARFGPVCTRGFASRRATAARFSRVRVRHPGSRAVPGPDRAALRPLCEELAGLGQRNADNARRAHVSRKRGPGTELFAPAKSKRRTWSAERRRACHKARAANARKGRTFRDDAELQAKAPPGAPLPRVSRGTIYGVPGAAKNTGDAAHPQKIKSRNEGHARKKMRRRARARKFSPSLRGARRATRQSRATSFGTVSRSALAMTACGNRSSQ